MQPLTLTIVQTKLFWEDKKANLDMLQQKIEGIKERTEVVILPEMFSTGFSMQPESLAESMDGTTVQWMRKMAAEKRIILTGSIIIKENGHYFNRLIWMLPNGEYGHYDKRHLFAFAGEEEHYSAGKKRFIASVKGWKINMQVCYDLRFPVWARQSPAGADMHYDILINVANWPEKRSTAWKTLLQARAIENQCFVIGVNRVGEDANKNSYNGDSMLIGPLGEIVIHHSSDETISTFTLSKETITETRSSFPFLNDADSFMINE